jgi:hypothetical protein
VGDFTKAMQAARKLFGSGGKLSLLFLYTSSAR